MLGFLFGVPRTIQAEIDDREVSNRIEANTNLEQISDWLTKILVGVGLTQLNSILSYTKTHIIDNLTPSFGGSSNGSGNEIATSTTIGAFVYFLVCGFFIGYLWSRVYLTQSLEDEYNKVKTEISKTKNFSTKIQLVRQIIDSIPEHKYNNSLDFAYLKSDNNKLETYQNIYKKVDKVLAKLKNHLSDDDLGLPENLDKFLNSVEKDIDRDNEFFFLRATDYVKLGTIVALKLDFRKSIRFFDKALEINSASYEAYIFKGLCQWQLNYYDDALLCFDDAIKINSRGFSALNNKCGVLLDKVKHQRLSKQQKEIILEQALDAAKKAIIINPYSPIIYVNKGYIYSELKEYNKELESYRKALDIDDKYTLAWYNKACYYAARADNEQEAINCLKKAIDLNKDIIKYAKDEEDFKSLHNNDEFKALVNK